MRAGGCIWHQDMLASVTHNLGNLLSFRGRDDRSTFWPYAALVLLAALIATGAIFLPELWNTLGRIQRFAAEHPDEVTVSEQSGGYSIQFHSFHPELMPDFPRMISGMIPVAVLAVLLLAAAVVRRFRDRGRRAIWGLLPVLFLACGFVFLRRVFIDVAAGHALNIPLIIGVFFNNLFYIVALLLLIWHLAGPSVAASPATPRNTSRSR